MNILFEFLFSIWIISVSYELFVEWIQSINYKKILKKGKKE